MWIGEAQNEDFCSFERRHETICFEGVNCGEGEMRKRDREGSIKEG